MPSPYTHTSLLTARNALAQRLDPTSFPTLVYWTVPELNAYLIESLRTWQAYTAFYRDRVTMPTANLKSIYDLTTDIAQPGLFDYNVTNQSLYSTISNHLLEPPTNPWTGTDQFTLDQINQALQRRRDQFLADTGCVITRTYPIAVPAPPISRVPLPDTILDVRRVGWVTFDAMGNFPLITPLFRDNEYSAVSYLPSWPQLATDPPSFYSVSASPPLSLQIVPPPLNGATIELLSVSSGPALSTAPPPASSLLGIPDDYAWVIKWGALADLLASDSQSPDRARAAYCEARYRQGVMLAMLHPSILQAQINDVPVQIDTISNLDYYQGSWQSIASASTPSLIGMAGRNILGLAPVPDTGGGTGYSISFDLVRNMPIPTLDTDFIQVGRDSLDPILDYAQHLASFKLGGTDFDATIPLLLNFTRAASELNSRLRASNVYDLLMRLPALAPMQVLPRKTSPAVSQSTQSIGVTQ